MLSHAHPVPEPEPGLAQEGDPCDDAVDCDGDLDCEEGVCIQPASTDGNTDGNTDGSEVTDAGGSGDGDVDGSMTVDAGGSSDGDVDGSMSVDAGGTSDGTMASFDAGGADGAAEGQMMPDAGHWDAVSWDAGDSEPVGCDAGYVANDHEECEPLCTPDACGGVGHCVVRNGAAVCMVCNEAGTVFANGECVDVNECDTDNGGCDTHATCTNGANSGDAPSCECNSGYEGNGTDCTDVNECDTNNGGCGDSTYYACSNNVGDDPTCADINECETNNGGCHANATCTNNVGAAATCECNSGYEGNGTDCTDVNECDTNNGGCGDSTYYACSNNVGDDPTCADINECETNNGGCHANATCTNNVGAAATCECNVGYTGNGTDCTHANVVDAASECSTGTHVVNRGDGTYQCVPLSTTACAGAADLETCAYSWGASTVTGSCYGGACQADCSAAGNDCANPNSMCQATGQIGRDGTDYICLANDTYASAGACPSQTHIVVVGNGTFQCIQPSVGACAGRSDSEACSYSWGTIEGIEGRCWGGACHDTCTLASLNDSNEIVVGAACENSNSVCQASSLIGASESIGVCQLNTTFTAANQCASGSFVIAQGDGTFHCVPPSINECKKADVADDGQLNDSNAGTACELIMMATKALPGSCHRACL